MIDDTRLHKIGGSMMVLIPPLYVKHLKLGANYSDIECHVEELNDKELKISFG
jgi:hypothetical protein